MKKVLFVLFFLFLIRIGFGGCPGPKITTSNGINSGYNYSSNYSIYENPTDSFYLTMTHNFCYIDHNSTISFNGQVIQVSKSSFTIKLPLLLGKYTITASGCRWEISIVNKPTTPSAPTTIPQNTSADSLQSSTSILLKKEAPNPDFLFYPNPILDQITLENESDEIRFVTFYSSSGLLFSKYDMRGAKVTIPLNNYPAGIYFMQVVTLSDKIIIKKFSIY